MNFTETFQDFSARVGVTDLALYAGVGLVVWILFQDKLNNVFSGVGSLLKNVSLKTPNLSGVVKLPASVSATNSEDKFFELVASWKKTRDLAVETGCSEAVKVADQMFPYLSPQVCNKEKNNA